MFFLKKINLSLLLMVSLLLASCNVQHPIPVPTVLNARTPCINLVKLGFPTYSTPQQNDWFICHDGYALEYNPRSKTPMWVAEHLTADNLKNKIAVRQEDFRPDPNIDLKNESSLSSFSGSGYDRGHMAPAEDFKNSIRQMSESFYLSNMVPQNPDNNRGIWARLEKNIRLWTFKKGELYVFTGPVFINGNPQGWIGENLNQVAIPTHLYKVILDPKEKEVFCFLIPNTAVPIGDLNKYGAKLSDIEKLTGLNFFPTLSKEKSMELDHSAIPSHWLIK